jgi:hypothetical protein
MAEQCQILEVTTIKLRAAMSKYLKDRDSKSFLMTLTKKPGVSTVSRIDARPTDTTASIEQTNKNFLTMFDVLARSIAGSTKRMSESQAIAAFNELRGVVTSTLFNRLDNNSEGNPGENTDDSDAYPEEETKSLKESLDKNRARLDEHLKDFYGDGSYNIINNLFDTFEDNIMSASYWDSTTGGIVAYNNAILNNRIQAYKNSLYSQIVKFLKQKGIVSEDTIESMVTPEG